jgi:4-hydroxybenzoate polyprenyltransferase
MSSGGASMPYQLLLSMRPKQWSKNVIVFAGLFFAEDIFNPEKIKAALFAFAAFCLISSSGYLINDVVDREKDKLHPVKRNRPIAAGKLAWQTAIAFAVVFILLSLYASFSNNLTLGLIIVFYFALTFSYSLLLKRLIIVDVMIIASGFMLRAIGGTIAIEEPISSWLIICTIFLALFLALTKRRAEVMNLGDNAATVRKTLAGYNLSFLDQMINVVTAACLMAYALYTLDPATVEKFGTRNLMFTLPFVIYGLFRYLFLVHNRNLGEAPDVAILKDIPILLCIFLYAATVVAIIYF